MKKSFVLSLTLIVLFASTPVFASMYSSCKGEYRFGEILLIVKLESSFSHVSKTAGKGTIITLKIDQSKVLGEESSLNIAGKKYTFQHKSAQLCHLYLPEHIMEFELVCQVLNSEAEKMRQTFITKKFKITEASFAPWGEGPLKIQEVKKSDSVPDKATSREITLVEYLHRNQDMKWTTYADSEPMSKGIIKVKTLEGNNVHFLELLQVNDDNGIKVTLYGSIRGNRLMLINPSYKEVWEGEFDGQKICGKVNDTFPFVICAGSTKISHAAKDVSWQKDLRIALWQQNCWNIFPLSKVTVKKLKDCLQLQNTSNVHYHVKIFHYQLLAGDFQAEVEYSGMCREIGFTDDKGGDHNVFLPISSTKRQKIFLTRKDGKLTFEVAGQKSSGIIHNGGRPDMKGYVYLNLHSEESMNLYSFKIIENQ